MISDYVFHSAFFLFIPDTARCHSWNSSTNQQHVNNIYPGTHVSHFDNKKERFVLDRPLPLQSRTLISFDDLCLFLNIECELR